MAEKPQPVRVLYCSVCSLPAEYCEFGPDFEKCKPWLIKNALELYPDLLKESNEKEAEKVSGKLQSVGLSSGGADSGEASSSKEEVKRLPGGKIKKKDKQEVIIEKVVRNKRKCITIVKGLDLFGIKLSDASKKLGKKFATGASVVKGPTEKEQIDVQGDISYDIVEFISDTWPAVISLSISFLSLLSYIHESKIPTLNYLMEPSKFYLIQPRKLKKYYPEFLAGMKFYYRVYTPKLFGEGPGSVLSKP